MRILLAEDERITRRSVERQLDSWGHDVVSVADGAEAADAYGNQDFDLIISDWDMPRMSGIELVRHVRSMEDRPFVYVMMLTGRDDTGDIVAGLQAGADDYLAKPFRKEELRARLHAGERLLRAERLLVETIDELRQSASRVKRDLDAAARLQQQLLPAKELSHPAVDLAWRYQPCDELGGDALGFELVDNEFLVAYLLDVSGHGVPAALLSYSASQSLSRNAGLTVVPGDCLAMVSPGDVAKALNDRFSMESTGSRFFTLYYSIIELRTGRMDFVSAGHELPLLYRNGERVPLGDTQGLPIGVAPDEVYGSGAVQLEAGDRLYFFSDGVPEQLDSEKSMFSVVRVDEELSGSLDVPAGDAMDRLLRRLRDWSGGAFDDDVSIAAIDWVGEV